jgi:UDP-glucose 4-epimerase
VRAVVTGGAGFIGSHVADALLARGDHVTIVDDLSTGKRERIDPAATFVEHDIRNPLEVDADVVFHLAAQADVRVSVERPEHDAAVNVIGTINVLEAARATGAKVVFTSTGGAIYGDVEQPATEEHVRQPLAPYGTSKLTGEEYLATWNRLYRTGHVTLRFGNVYGPRQDPHGEAGVVAIFLGRLRDGQPCRIFGDGRQTRDYVYVGDAVRATLAAAGHDGGVFNVGTGAETSVVELFEACRAAAGVDAEPEFADARPGELQRSVLDVSLAAAELGWRPETSLADGIRQTWESVRKE